MGLTEIIGFCPTKNMDFIINFKYDTVRVELFGETLHEKADPIFSCAFVERGNDCEYHLENCPLYIKYNFLVNGDGKQVY